MNAIAEYVKHTIECCENKSVIIQDYKALDKYLADCGSFRGLRMAVRKFEQENHIEWGFLPEQLRDRKPSVAKVKKTKAKIDPKLAKVIKRKTKIAEIAKKKASQAKAKIRQPKRKKSIKRKKS